VPGRLKNCAEPGEKLTRAEGAKTEQRPNEGGGAQGDIGEADHRDSRYRHGGGLQHFNTGLTENQLVKEPRTHPIGKEEGALKHRKSPVLGTEIAQTVQSTPAGVWTGPQ